MPKRTNLEYPANVAVRVFGDLDRVPGGYNARNIEDAIALTTAKDKKGKLQQFVDLRYKQNMTYKAIADVMGYMGVERPRQLDSKFVSHMHCPEAVAIVQFGKEDSNQYIELSGGRWEICIKDMELDIRSYNSLVLYIRYHSDDNMDVDQIKAKHIITLFRNGKISKVRNLGPKVIKDKLIPRLKALGFTNEELNLDEGGNMK